MDKKRIEYLDSVRGLAAISVLVYHVIGSHWDWTLAGKISRIIFNGTGAVAMFFVLSGLVLSKKLIHNKTVITAQFMNRFLMRRVFRLYPPFLFCLLFYSLIQIDSTSLKFILEESTLIRKRHVLYPPDWTLGVELAMSLFVPFLIIILIKCQRLFIWFIIMTSLIGDSYVSKFILLFGLGVLLAKNFEKIQTYKCNHWLYRNKHYLLPLLILPFSYKHITHLFPLPNFVNYTLENILEINEFTLSGVSSFLLLLYIINSQRIQKLLSAKILVFIGKVSYGVYLSHWFFTLIILKHMDFILATWTNNSKVYFLVFYLSTTLLGSILAGWLIYRFIEIPFIAYSKRLQKKLSAVV